MTVTQCPWCHGTFDVPPGHEAHGEVYGPPNGPGASHHLAWAVPVDGSPGPYAVLHEGFGNSENLHVDTDQQPRHLTRPPEPPCLPI